MDLQLHELQIPSASQNAILLDIRPRTEIIRLQESFQIHQYNFKQLLLTELEHHEGLDGMPPLR